MCLLAIAAPCIAAGVVSCASNTGASQELAASTNEWHERRMERLRAPDGWLSLVALESLRQGSNTVGRSAAADVEYAGFPMDRVGAFLVDGDRVRFEPAPGADVEGLPSTGVLRTDADGDPTVLSIGDIRFHVIVRGGGLMVRIKDASAPTRTNFAGIERFPVDSSWRITAAFTPAEPDRFIGMDTVIGVREEGRVAGRARFERDGVKVDAVLLDAGNGASLLRFGDATNGTDTYIVGRYLYVEPSVDGETVVLDFNRAYNPPCAFTPYATCTIPPASNEFAFPVTAGERWETAAKELSDTNGK